jgi:hypothetical protein
MYMNTLNSAQISKSGNDLKKLQNTIHDLIEKIMTPYFEKFEENSDRVTNLVLLHATLKQNQQFCSDPSLDDILRASIVFTHASLEDFLRTLASELLPLANEEALNQIPLNGLNASGRTEKFFLGNLARFRGKLVDDVIQESVFSSLQRSTYNSTNDIAQLLKSLGIDVSKINRSFPKIEELMQRRHLIVHRADKVKQTDLDEEEILEIDSSKVIDWLKAVLELIADILREATVHQLFNDVYLKKTGGEFTADI